MDFVIQWLWYLLAFMVGSLVAWLISVRHDQADKRRGSARGSSWRAANRAQSDARPQLVVDGRRIRARSVLTLSLTIRRVKSEVPESAAAKFTDTSADETTKTSRGRSQRDEQ